MLFAEKSDAMIDNTQQAERLLKVLANQHRLRILCCLLQGEKTAGELEEASDLAQSAASQHLAKLRKEGIVHCQRRGQKVYYQLVNIEAHAILTTLYLAYCKE